MILTGASCHTFYTCLVAVGLFVKHNLCIVYNLELQGKIKHFSLDYFILCKLSQFNLPLNYSSVLGTLKQQDNYDAYIMIYEIAKI